MPKRIRKVDDTYADQDVVRKLFQAAGKRNRIILRIFVSCGLRQQETFALRANDIEIGRLQVDEALKQAERGAAFIDEPKTTDSYGYVSLPAKLESELRAWVRDESIPPEGWLFPASRGGGPIRPNNYVKRDLAKLAEAAGVGRINLRRLRRTCATYLRDEATAQGQLRHSSVETTKRHHLKAIPAEQKARVENSIRSCPDQHWRRCRIESGQRSRNCWGSCWGKNKRRSVKFFRMWYARVDSNHRPFAPEANALSS